MSLSLCVFECIPVSLYFVCPTSSFLTHTQHIFVVVVLLLITVNTDMNISYPLAFTGVRDGILDIANVKDEKRTDGLLNAVTVTLLAGVTGLALVIRDLRVLLAFGGATWGNFVTYLFPICMLLSLAKKNSAKVSTRELPIAWTVLVAGLVMSAIGTQQALQMR